MRRGFKNFLALILSIAVLSGVCCAVSTDNNDSVDVTVGITPESDSSVLSYEQYSRDFGNEKYSSECVSRLGGNYLFEKDSGVQAGTVGSKENVLIWKSGEGKVTWRVDVSERALYNLYLVFLPLKSGIDIEYKIMIDGVLTFKELETVIFSRDWKNKTSTVRIDAKGNEIAPEQCETGEYIRRTVCDDSGVIPAPYLFLLEPGEHTVTLQANGYAVALAEIGFSIPETVNDYKTVSDSYNIKTQIEANPVVIHAEDASVKSSNMLIPKSTNSNAGMYPSSYNRTKINSIGGSAWNSPGQKLTWEFEVKSSGYYKFGARYKQNELVNGSSKRWLKIDEKTPFNEAKSLNFEYGTGWRFFEMGDKDTPYFIYLEKGMHSLSLEVTLAENSELYGRLYNNVNKLGDLYLQIVMITGENPDINYDYELFRQIPDFNKTLGAVSDSLVSIADDMKSKTDKRANQCSLAIGNMNRVIKRMLNAPYLAHIYVKDFYTNYTVLCSWLSEMKKMPLAIDEMQFVPAGSDFDWKQPDIFESISFGVKRLIATFTDDYNSDSADGSGDALTIWLNWGRDQTMALNSIIKDSFTAKTGINVNLKIVSNSLINGLLADNFPDLQLGLTRTAPVNYGIRGALLDLTQFDDCGEVLKRFRKGADIPYRYNEALYALPDTQTFYLMFYRTDIFEELDLKVPGTWEEFINCASVIRRRNMNVYIPYTQITTTTTVENGIGIMNLFPTLMLQSGNKLYNNQLNATAMRTENAIKVFEKWTKLYTDYSYPKEADFYNRFRNGSMPLGIAPYTTYMTVYSAAPEIYGRWSVASIPATNGGTSVVSGGGTGCSIVKRSKFHKEAWEFLKWWTSAEVQIRYNLNIESILGMLGRIPTSNTEAFSSFFWKPGDCKKITAQWENVEEIPEIPGSYYVTRAVDQAFYSVINDKVNPKDAITKWSKVADNEISRKIRQYDK